MFAHLIDLTQPLSYVVEELLSPPECAEIIARIEREGPKVAPISRPGGAVIDLSTRNNSRVMLKDAELAALLFQRVKPHLPRELRERHIHGANELLRCYRYAQGQRFRPHYDSAFERSPLERSELTFLVYLNEGFAGGETALLDLEEIVRPKTGRALLFQHAILHEGCEVTSGVKYVLRSDVMYRAGLPHG